jgi:hypothetical protein
MSRPQLNWSSEPLLLVRGPDRGYGTLTLQEYRDAGPHVAALDVVGIVPEEHASNLLQDLPAMGDVCTVVFRRSPAWTSKP